MQIMMLDAVGLPVPSERVIATRDAVLQKALRAAIHELTTTGRIKSPNAHGVNGRWTLRLPDAENTLCRFVLVVPDASADSLPGASPPAAGAYSHEERARLGQFHILDRHAIEDGWVANWNPWESCTYYTPTRWWTEEIEPILTEVLNAMREGRPTADYENLADGRVKIHIKRPGIDLTFHGRWQ